jgi:hypothetical protein
MSPIASSLLWYFLPTQLTQAALPYLSSALPAILPLAAKGSPEYASNFRKVYTALVAGYIIWTFAQTDVGWGEDMYVLLGVDRGAGDDALRKAFRTM